MMATNLVATGFITVQNIKNRTMFFRFFGVISTGTGEDPNERSNPNLLFGKVLGGGILRFRYVSDQAGPVAGDVYPSWIKLRLHRKTNLNRRMMTIEVRPQLSGQWRTLFPRNAGPRMAEKW